MCIICVEFQSGKLRLDEARRNLREMAPSLGEEHSLVVEELLKEEEKEVEDVFDWYIEHGQGD